MNLLSFRLGFRAAWICAVGLALLAGGTETGRAQADPPSAPAELPPGVQDVIKLTQAGLNEDLIIAQVRSAGYLYRLTADQILTIANAGVSQNVIKALIEPAAPPAVPPPAPAPAAAPVPPAPAESAAVEPPLAAPADFDSFENALAPFGMWIQVPGYGWAWVPGVAATDPGWQPYADEGCWIYTDLGWYWNSYYPWGNLPFHYGRWTRMAGYGWAWIPDYTWGPAWVCWRHDEADDCCGWAPLPPEAHFVSGLGIVFHGHLALDIDFGLPAVDFAFCRYGQLLDRNVHGALLPRERVNAVFGRSVVHNAYRLVDGRLDVESLGQARLEPLVHRVLQPAPVRRPPVQDDQARVEWEPRNSYRQGEPRPVPPLPPRAAVPALEGREPAAREGGDGRGVERPLGVPMIRAVTPPPAKTPPAKAPAPSRPPEGTLGRVGGGPVGGPETGAAKTNEEAKKTPDAAANAKH